MMVHHSVTDGGMVLDADEIGDFWAKFVESDTTPAPARDRTSIWLMAIGIGMIIGLAGGHVVRLLQIPLPL